MSQIGAVMMSDQGTDFATILSTYYTGVTVEARD
jgi:peptidoglycan hydrolase-like amidase